MRLRMFLPAALAGALALAGVRAVDADAPAPGPGEAEGGAIRLGAGQFGKALDAGASPVEIDGNPAFRQPPFTVECRARLRSKKDFNVLVACDPKTSSDHWEIYTQAGSGAFGAFLSGFEPAELASGTDVADGRWHFLAMTHDGKMVRLFVDGKRVLERAVARKAGLKPEPGRLAIGLARAGKQRVGCDGWIEEVRLSRGTRTLDRVPTARLPLDAPTLGLWHFDRPDVPTVDPAWTPRPAAGNAFAWEKETDADWVDGRFRATDTGPFLNATIEYPAPGVKARAFKGTAIKVGNKGEGAVLFDRCRLQMAAGWTGGFLRHSDKRFGLLNTPTPAGPLAFTTRPGPGWADPRGAWEDPHPATAPLPHEWAHYRGLHLHGKHVVLSYTAGTAAVLESPWLETSAGWTAFTRTLEVGASDRPLRLLAFELPAEGRRVEVGGVPFVACRQGDDWTAVALAGDDSATLELAGKVRVEVALPAGSRARRFKVFLWRGRGGDLAAPARLVREGPPPQDLAMWTRPGPARWTQPIVTRGEVAPDNAPYVLDTLTVPYANPYQALMFLSGVDFLPNGDLAVCTVHGDVWLVRGVDARLEDLRWKRFATGLYQPLGLKVVGGVLHVLERGQLTRLRDLDGDGEADAYENVCNDWHTGAGEHSYDTCLETDPAGNFYFFKTGDAETPTGGCLLRVAPDGGRVEVFATGFRHPIGLSVSPRAEVTGADQEGNWMPATRIDQYRRGGFYGDMRTHHRPEPPTIYDPPLCWLPHEIDNSAGGQVWVPPDRFGPLAGQLLHFSYGRCKLFLVLRQTVDDQIQGGGTDLGLFFLSGVMRGRFHPGDGHLYAAGLRGWQNAARRDGCLQRVRYTGQPVRLPLALAVHADGVRLTFSELLDRAAAEDPARYRLARWNYRWSGDYGSKRWSVARPDREGQDPVPVRSATLLKDGKSVFLRAPGLKPVMQMELSYNLTDAGGAPLAGAVYHTVQFLAPGPGRE